MIQGGLEEAAPLIEKQRLWIQRLTCNEQYNFIMYDYFQSLEVYMYKKKSAKSKLSEPNLFDLIRRV